MTNDQLAELRSLILQNAAAINRNYEMIGRIYEEHSGRFDRVEKRLDRVEFELTDFRTEWRSTHGHLESRLKALEN